MLFSVRNKIMMGYGTLLALTVLTVAFIVLNINNLLDSFNFLIDHDQPVLVGTSELEKLVVDMETGMRGYLVTGDQQFLEPLWLALYGTIDDIDARRTLSLEANGSVREHYDDLFELVNDNPAQQQQLGVVLDDIQAWLDNVANVAVPMRLQVTDASGTFDVLSEQLGDGQGDVIMDDIRTVVGQIRADVMGWENGSSVIVMLQDFQGTMIDMETGQRGFLVTGDETSLAPYNAGRAALESEISELRGAMVADSVNLARVDELDQLSQQWVTEIAEPEIAARRNIDDDQATFGDVIAFISTGIGKQHVDTIRASLIQFKDEEIRLNNIRHDEARDLANQTIIFTLGLTTISIAVGLFISLQIGNTISRNVADLVSVSHSVGEGDLSRRTSVQSNDEIGQLGGTMNQMIDNLEENLSTVVAKEYLEGMINRYLDFVAAVSEGDLTRRLDLSRLERNRNNELYQLGVNLNGMVVNLAEMAHQVRETASIVTNNLAEIQAATTEQAASTAQQSALVTETAATVEELRLTTRQTADRAYTVALAAEKSITVSEEGEEAVQDTIRGMDTVRQQVESIANNILSLSEKTQQIGEIIETVNALADQSKLISLNASIEAARSGEEGKGFSVVASEVRELAEQSQMATSHIQSILDEIQQATNTSVMVTEEGSKSSEQGMRLVESAGTVIRNLATVIDDASQAATQITGSTQQQINGMDQLSDAMTQIEQSTSQTAVSTRQTEGSVNELMELAHRLETAAARYRL